MCVFVVELGCLVGARCVRFVIFKVLAQLCVVGDVFGERLWGISISQVRRWWVWGLRTDLAAGESSFEFSTFLGDLCTLELELLAVDEVASVGGNGELLINWSL